MGETNRPDAYKILVGEPHKVRSLGRHFVMTNFYMSENIEVIFSKRQLEK
jgi:hypothetical protein